MTPEALRALFAPLCADAAKLDLSAPEAATAALSSTWTAERRAPLVAALREAHAAGWLTPRQANPVVWFGRVSKAVPELSGMSIDAVDMAGAAAEHVHPAGEISLCVPLEGAPTFYGAADGFVVVPPGSQHVPEVVGGRMLIAYLLPGGQINFL